MFKGPTKDIGVIQSAIYYSVLRILRSRVFAYQGRKLRVCLFNAVHDCPTIQARYSQSQQPPASSRRPTFLVPPPNQKREFPNPNEVTPWDNLPTQTPEGRRTLSSAGLDLGLKSKRQKENSTDIYRTHAHTILSLNYPSFRHNFVFIFIDFNFRRQQHSEKTFAARWILRQRLEPSLRHITAQILAPIAASQQSRQSKAASLQQSLLDR